MRLKLKELQKVVSQTLTEEKAVDALREEVSKAFGPSVITNVKLETLAENVNDRIDVLERTGRAGHFNLKPTLVLKFAESKSAEVRRMAARVLPEQFLSRFKSDRDPAVRHAVARRLSVGIVQEMLRQTPSDDELRQIYRSKKITEAGVPSPKVSDEHLDIYGEKLGAAVKQQPTPELSNQWYSMTAHKAISDYNHNIEGQWDEHWAHRYCASIKSVSGVVVDAKKLWNEIQKQLKDRDDRTLERYSLKEVARRLRESVSDDMESYFESIDPVEKLAVSNLSGSEFLREAAAVLSIRESILPRALQKYRVSEGKAFEMKIPCMGKIPGRKNITSLDERVLDMYVKRWNDHQAQVGEPVRISWSPSPNAMGAITFNVELK